MWSGKFKLSRSVWVWRAFLSFLQFLCSQSLLFPCWCDPCWCMWPVLYLICFSLFSDGLSKVVFMKHSDIGEFLGADNESKSVPRIASNIISVSIGNVDTTTLPQPVTFSLRLLEVRKNAQSCSMFCFLCGMAQFQRPYFLGAQLSCNEFQNNSLSYISDT